MVPVKLSICCGHSGYDDPRFCSLRFYYLNSMHSSFQLLTFNLIFHIPGHFLLSGVLRGSGVLPPKKILTNIMEISANLSKMCGVEIDYWGYQDSMTERYGFLEKLRRWPLLDPTRPDPPHFPKIVTRPDPTRGSTRPVDNSGLSSTVAASSSGWADASKTLVHAFI